MNLSGKVLPPALVYHVNDSLVSFKSVVKDLVLLLDTKASYVASNYRL